MSWHFSQALEEAYSAGTSSAGEPFAPSRLNPTPGTSCLHGKMTEPCPPSQSGTTSQLSTGDHGEELLTWYRAASLAKTSAPQAPDEESTEQEADCGEKWQESFARFDPDTRSWKTHQCSLLAGLDEFSETWPKWGIMRRGGCSELQTWEPPTSVSGYGSLLHHYRKGEYIPGVPTPLAEDADNHATRPANLRRDTLKLSTQAELGMIKAICFIPTPTTQGLRGGSHTAEKAKRVLYPTPLCQNAKELTPSPSNLRRKSPGLGALAAHGKIGPAGKLNPTWVEWLMGWPLGWTDLKPLETGRFHAWQRQCLSTLDSAWKDKP